MRGAVDPTVDPRVARRDQQRARERAALDVGSRLAPHLSSLGIGWACRAGGVVFDTDSASLLADLLDRIAAEEPSLLDPPTGD